MSRLLVSHAQRSTAPAAARGVLSSLKRGVRSTCMQLVSDSTGTDTDEWLAHGHQTCRPVPGLHGVVASVE